MIICTDIYGNIRQQKVVLIDTYIYQLLNDIVICQFVSLMLKHVQLLITIWWM